MPSNLTCAFPGCLNVRRKKGLCSTHYNQSRTGQPLRPLYSTKRPNGTPPRIICDEVTCPVPGLIGPCHVFRGSKDGDGYGHVRFLGGRVKVHRYIWEKENGPIPDDLEIDHQCRVTGCCNTDHLRAVTHKVNTTENIVGANWQKNLAKTHCPQGHPYSDENTYINGTNRQCRKCHRMAYRKKRLKLKGMIE